MLRCLLFFFFKQKTAYEMRISDWSSDVCSSDLGFLKIIRQDRWVAVAGTNWWAANKALDLLDPVFTVTGTLIGNDSIDAALEAAFDSGDEARLFERGNVESLFDGAKIITSEYQAAPALHLAMEPMAATAHVHDGQAEIRSEEGRVGKKCGRRGRARG